MVSLLLHPIDTFTFLLAAWMQAPWPLALLAAVGVHLSMYLVGGSIAWTFNQHFWPSLGVGRNLDPNPPRPGQVRMEIRHGMVACLILAVMTLSYRSLSDGIWPRSVWTAAWQLAAFVFYNAVYSYGTHRLLHTRWLIRAHGVHHRSVRVTPFTSYSVHPLEGLVIACTIPSFMLIVPLGVGSAFLLHGFGLAYTAYIHSNYDLLPQLPEGHWFKRLIDHPIHHRFHHTLGNVNFGFTGRWLDRLFGTHKL
ncbi:sterol desaturase family protein [Piscinibacter terrae]|uniref:Sterol desaturase family protein n=1 Tax=Piscinibacter terrae TaxID=2496871 RepID=A0A3N7HQX2_9BURK|nr:sterol desaturase family protein [Albitalea terrae]RQP23181.1 sterol desaturase family protein [Albitalea terrae]